MNETIERTNESTEQRRQALAVRRSNLSDVKKAAFQRRLRGLSSAPSSSAIARSEERTGIHPASFSQQRLWFLDQLIPGSAAYNLGMAVELRGRLDSEALLRSIRELTRRHDVLRTTFRQNGEAVEQVVAPLSKADELQVTVVDLTQLVADARGAEREAIARAELTRPFDLTTGPLFRPTLVVIDESTHELHLMMHHAVCDGWSVGVILQELATLYEAYARGGMSPLGDLGLQYADVARWQRERLRGEVLSEHLSYWKQHLAGAPEVLQLPQAGPRPASPTYAGRSVTSRWKRELVAELKGLSQREDATLFMTLLAAFQVLLMRYSGQTDVVVGTPVANRPLPEMEPLIGFFVNTLALRTDLAGEPSFVEVLRRVKETCLGGYAHQELPFERLVEELRPERDLRRHPVYQVMLALQNAPAPSIDLPGVQLAPMEAPSETSKFDLTLSLEESGEELNATLEYSTELFEPALAERMLEHLEVLLREIVKSPERAVTRHCLMAEAERELVIETWNATTRAGTTQLAHELVAAQAAQRPDAVAVVYSGQRVTYGELNERANQLAGYLRGKGVGPEVLVALALERTVEMVVAVLAVWKAGGAYVPVDPAYPAARIQVMLEIAQAPVLVTQEWLCQGSWPSATEVVCLQRDAASIAACALEAPQNAVTGQNLSHVIFTSGSTGTPKGVAIRHQSVSARLGWVRERFSDTELSGMLAATSLSFDLSVFELWGALAWGGTVILAGTVLDYPELPARAEVRLINTVPSAMSELAGVSDLEGVVTVNLAGEALPRELVTALYAKPSVTKVYNLYGPSEDTTYSTEELVPPHEGGRPRIGRPLPNTKTYILDRNGEPAPVGVAGELYVAGCGLAREYLRRADLTAERFVENRFGTAGEKMYRTGDLARYLTDGRIDYLGRLDHQVKIRGFRIEPGDIEAALRQADMREAVVLVREWKGQQMLVAYAVPASRPWPTEKEVQAALAQRLPQYMVPTVIIFLDALPLSPNGKLDRNALPARVPAAAEPRRVIGPRDPVEHRLVEIWEQLLDVRPIGVTDDFFELGGHSLLVLGLAAEIERRFQRRLPIAGIFGARTVAGIAALLRQGVLPETPAILIRAADSARTLFCVHPASGNAFVYKSLAQRLGAHGLVGLHARGLTNDDDPVASVHEMAAEYVAAIRMIQPEGPYALAGWSLGGVVAHEMAIQLVTAGQTVDMVALLDTFPPGAATGDAPIGVDDVEILAELAREYGLDCQEVELRALDREARIERVLAAARDAQLLPEGAGRREIERVIRTYQANLAALEQHKAGRYSGRVLLCLAEQTTVEAPDAQRTALGWNAICGSPPEVRVVRGTHRTLVFEPEVESVGTLLTEELSLLQKVV